MYKVAVIGEKGGIGKTTISLELAVAAERKGNKTAVIDLDSQAAASEWTDRRKAETPWVVPTHAARLKATILEAAAEGVSFIVIDTPANSIHVATEAARVADMVVLPIEPHIYALNTLTKMSDVLLLAGSPAALVVLNKAPIQGRESASAIEFISSQGFKVCPVILYQRAAHRHAANVGLTAAEFAPHSKAADETLALFNHISKLLNKGNGKHA